MVPTDRSMPAVMMTKVHAIASTPLTAVDVMVRFACDSGLGVFAMVVFSMCSGGSGNSGRTLRCQLHDFFLRGFGGAEFAGDAAFAHDQHAVAHAQHFWQLGRNHHDGLALFCEGVEQFVDFALGADVNATRWLIKKQDVAVAQQ